MNDELKGYGWKWPWLNLGYCSGICFGRLRITTEISFRIAYLWFEI
jgi:hypothetical protein